MKLASVSTGKGLSFYTYLGRGCVAIGTALTILIAFFSLTCLSVPPAFAATYSLSRATYTTSPASGPVGAVIMVSGNGLNNLNGTQINLGYVSNGTICTIVTDSQVSRVNNGSFSGWFRWPSNTSTGTMGVCLSAEGGNTLQIGVYTVLSATPAQIAVNPGSLNAGKQATVSGSNFVPKGTSVVLVWQASNGSQTLSLGSVTSDDNGAFSQTFTVPENSSTGSYSITATVGSSQPPTLNVSTTFHVDGITIASVPTPGTGTQASPTAVPTGAAIPTAVGTSTTNTLPTHNQTGTVSAPATGPGILLPIIAGGSVLVVLALIGGCIVVIRQRRLVALNAQAPEDWSGLPGPTPTFVPQPPAQIYTGALPPAGNPATRVASGALDPAPGGIPFDPALAEAMRQAQVSLYAMPRPPVGEEVPS